MNASVAISNPQTQVVARLPASGNKSNTASLLLSLLLLAVPAAVQAQSGDGYGYSINPGNPNTITITNYTGPGGSVTIPTNINGLTVAAIGADAFFSDTNLTSVIIPGTVTSIGESAFLNCRNATNITIPDSVTSLGGSAFGACSSLAFITIPASVTNIGLSAFGFDNLTAITVDPSNSFYSSVAGVLFDKNQTTLIQFPSAVSGSYAIPGTVTNLGENAFLFSDLTSITIPGSFTSIPEGAFAECFSLTNVTLPAGVTSIGDSAFAGCQSLANINLPMGITSLGDNAFSDCFALTNLVFPDSVTNIGASAFQVCLALTNVTIPNGVTSIGSNAFFESGLASVMIPASVTSIGAGAFAFCPLPAIAVDPSNSFFSSVNGVLFDKNQITLIEFPAGVNGGLPPLPGAGGTDYAIPGTVAVIGAIAFEGCRMLTNVTIPAGLTCIGDAAFFESGLTGIAIPAGVTNIGTGAFSDCPLAAITVDPSNPFYGSANGVLFDKSQTTLLQYPGGASGSYAVPGSVTNIGDYAFQFCGLTSITVPGSVTSVGFYPFVDSASLTGVYFEGNAPAAALPAVAFATYGAPTVFYLPGTTGWSSNFDSLNTALWSLPNPLILNSRSGLGVQSNGFGFTVSWATNLSVVVEACANLARPVWVPLQTNTLTNGSFYFSDSQWPNSPRRFYRITTP